MHLLIDLCDGGDLLTGTSNESEDGGSFAEDAAASVVEDVQDERIDATHQSRSIESWKPFTEAAAATTIRAVLRALAACHAHGVVHRDVKPANFLYMREPDGSRRAKLSDFGLAARIKERDGVLTERCGTYAYLSPEMARRRPYDFKVDAWAAGVVAYMLLAGEPPFADWDAIRDGRNPTREGLLRAIRRGRPVTPVDDLSLSPGAKSLLKALLEPNPEKRMSCAAAAEHYWVRERGAASHADALAETVVEKLQAYGTLGAVRRACLRAAFEEFESLDEVESNNEVMRSARDASARLVAAVDEAAERACVEHAEECDVSNMWGTSDKRNGVSAEALELALRDHGAELAPEEWLSLIRPFASGKDGDTRNAGARRRGAFVRNAALSAALAAPLGGSFAETERDAARADDDDAFSRNERTNAEDSLTYDWTAVAAASFRRLLAKDPARSEPRPASALPDAAAIANPPPSRSTTWRAGCVPWGARGAVSRDAALEFDAGADGDGRLGIAEWTDLVWSEGLMDGSGRVKSSCGADAPAHDPNGPRVAGVGNPGCELAPEASVRRPPTERALSPREKARAAAEARKKMAAQRRDAKNARARSASDPRDATQEAWWCSNFYKNRNDDATVEQKRSRNCHMNCRIFGTAVIPQAH